MIIRIMTEGQYKLEGQALTELDELDDSLLDAIERDDGEGFVARWQQVLDLVRQRSTKVEDAELVESDLILPAPDTTLDEARQLFASYPRQLV
jgi:hypothetical protein